MPRAAETIVLKVVLKTCITRGLNRGLNSQYGSTEEIGTGTFLCY